MPFVIQHKITKELFKARSGKTSWQKAAHAKNTFANSVRHYYLELYDLVKYSSKLERSWDSLKYDEQDVWEIVELKTTTEIKYGEAVKLLEECRSALFDFGDTNSNLYKRIEEFLIGRT